MAPVRDGVLMVDQGNFEKYEVAVDDWRKIKSKALKPSSPKIAFLMMVYRRIAFPETWKELLSGASEDEYSMVIHAAAEPELPEFFKKYLMDKSYETAHCDMTFMMLKMLENALLRDPDATHFTMVSGDSLPLRGVADILLDLEAESSSRFCVDPEWTRAESWFTVRRDHAALLAGNMESFHTLIRMRTMSCVDEESFYWSLMERDEDVVDHCTMMVDWAGTDKYWAKTAKRCECPEFIENSTKVGPDEHCGRPAQYHEVTAKGLRQILASPAKFWHVRKFPGDVDDGIALVRGALRKDSVLYGLPTHKKEVVHTLDDVMAAHFQRRNQGAVEA